jgi:threonine/homoserine/homoserine lactone efflux protein
MWWLTIGIALITRSLEIGIWAFILFDIIHWLCDAVWYTVLATFSFKGGRFLGMRFQKWAFGICGISLIVFGGMFLYDVILAK